MKSPSFATGVGLAKYGAEQLRQASGKTDSDPDPDPVPAGIGVRIKQWFGEVF